MAVPKVIEDDLYDLSRKAGVLIDRRIFTILLNLINMNCHPSVIYYMVKQPLGQFTSSAPHSSGTESSLPKLTDRRQSRASKRNPEL
ncbi:expressed conserved protein [Echinococcus multilocularis]|uniref:Expressed conserved protein n=1 Tax=Echinococcus multilocularis TaxID=6211 RepID=A0A087W0T5_ECHMU|nr:expressed conserved protein [Echinococcus multilocularis]